MMDQILDHCEGVIRITDDIIIHGKDDAVTIVFLVAQNYHKIECT